MNIGSLFQLASVHLIQISILFVAVWLFHLCLAKRYPHFVFVLWIVFFIKCLVPPVFSAPVSVFSNWADDRAVIRLESSNGPSVKDRYDDTVKYIVNKNSAANESILKDNSNSDTRGRKSSDRPRVVLPPTWVMAGWLTVSVLLLTVSLAYLVIVRRKIFEKVTQPGQKVASLFEAMIRKTGLSTKKTQLIVTDSNYGPLIFGFFKTYVVIPKMMADIEQEEMEPVLAHELCHIRRKDHWIGLLQVITVSAFWFHPFVWIANRKFEQLSELCCDDDTIGIFQFRPTKYARGLLAVLESMEFKSVLMAPGIRAADLTKDRVKKIVQNTRVSLFRSSGVFLAIALLLITLPYRSSNSWSFGVDPQFQAIFGDTGEGFESKNLDVAKRTYRLESLSENFFSQMDPFVGRWEIFQGESHRVGKTEFGYERNGKILRENFVGLGADSGHGISYFDPKIGKWKVTWVDSSGAVSELSGNWNGESIDLLGTRISADGQETPCRNSLIPVGENEFHVQLWRYELTSGQWVKTIPLIYRRMK